MHLYHVSIGLVPSTLCNWANEQIESLGKNQQSMKAFKSTLSIGDVASHFVKTKIIYKLEILLVRLSGFLRLLGTILVTLHACWRRHPGSNMHGL